MKPDKRFSSPIQSVTNKTLTSQQRIEKGPYRSANPIRRASAVLYEIGTINEHQCLAPNTYDSFRRMSAPELPPILDTKKKFKYKSNHDGKRKSRIFQN